MWEHIQVIRGRNHLSLDSMASNLLQITSQFTEDCIAITASPCQRCSIIIQPGEKRFYVAPHDQPDKPGRYICGKCMDHYLRKSSTTARIGTGTTMSGNFLYSISFSTALSTRNFAASNCQSTAGHVDSARFPPPSTSSGVAASGPSINLATIRAMVNESQRRGKSILFGRT